jgi:hypothetical protein
VGLTGAEFADRLGSAIGTRAGTWQFIRDFASGWLSPLVESDGCGEDRMAAVERRLGLRLPAAITEAYALLGNRHDMTSNQDCLLGPEEIDVDYAEEALVFREESKGAATWGVPLHQLDEADPPVAFRMHMADWHDESWDAWLPRFSLACVEIVLSESLHSAPALRACRRQTADDTRRLEERYPRLALPEYPTSQTAVPAVRWFAGQDVLLRDDQRQVLWARARTPAALEGVRLALPGDWQRQD